uniref:NADH-ubiquinone oxidoreductase chain 4L n=1 Tax=Columbicola columbae TaxID=128991 RepID=A0A6G7SJK3_9NEOP|nr:NADH dehydrogenase subunit 4L [Columbicola columbae]
MFTEMVFFFFFLFSLIKIIDDSNILSILISMEMVTGCGYLIMVLTSKVTIFLGGFIPILFLCVCVCEGAIGLSIVTKMVKKNYSISHQVFSWVKI